MRFVLLALIGCGSPDRGGGTTTTPGLTTGAPRADVVSVSWTGNPGSYVFAVGIRSDETGCDQYADWWELVSPEGELVYRRILDHSHPTEQPFVRGGEEPVAVAADTELVARAHLHPTGYGGSAMSGSVGAGFSNTDLAPGFAADLATAEPLPEICLF